MFEIPVLLGDAESVDVAGELCSEPLSLLCSVGTELCDNAGSVVDG